MWTVLDPFRLRRPSDHESEGSAGGRKVAADESVSSWPVTSLREASRHAKANCVSLTTWSPDQAHDYPSA